MAAPPASGRAAPSVDRPHTPKIRTPLGTIETSSEDAFASELGHLVELAALVLVLRYRRVGLEVVPPLDRIARLVAEDRLHEAACLDRESFQRAAVALFGELHHAGGVDWASREEAEQLLSATYEGRLCELLGLSEEEFVDEFNASFYMGLVHACEEGEDPVAPPARQERAEYSRVVKPGRHREGRAFGRKMSAQAAVWRARGFIAPARDVPLRARQWHPRACGRRRPARSRAPPGDDEPPDDAGCELGFR